MLKPELSCHLSLAGMACVAGERAYRRGSPGETMQPPSVSLFYLQSCSLFLLPSAPPNPLALTWPGWGWARATVTADYPRAGAELQQKVTKGRWVGESRHRWPERVRAAQRGRWQAQSGVGVWTLSLHCHLPHHNNRVGCGVEGDKFKKAFH